MAMENLMENLSLYGKSIAGVVAAAATQFDLIDYNEAGQILIQPPTDLFDAFVKIAAVGIAVYYVGNKGKEKDDA